MCVCVFAGLYMGVYICVCVHCVCLCVWVCGCVGVCVQYGACVCVGVVGVCVQLLTVNSNSQSLIHLEKDSEPQHLYYICRLQETFSEILLKWLYADCIL